MAELDLTAYDGALSQHAQEIGVFRDTRRRAFNEELERWKASESFTFSGASTDLASDLDLDQLEGETITCPITASVWKVLVADAEMVKEGQEIAVLESMKTEVPLIATAEGAITMLVAEGQTVTAGQAVAVVDNGA